jgi:thymidylate kinase
MAASARLLNRLAEDCYRQIISWSYQLRGYIVLYDRHFVFDAAQSNLNGRKRKDRLSNRVHRWLLKVVYPKPDLVIFLDAPPAVLFNRKVEVTLDYLAMRRKAFLHQGTTTANFFCIDAAQPVENVYADVHQCILRFLDSSKEKTFEPTTKRTTKTEHIIES